MLKKITLLLIWVTACVNLKAQTPTDGLMMPHGQLCILGQYSNSSWENYWQGETKRSNSNLGTVTTQSAMVMGNYGITSKLNVMLGLPYVWTSSDVSYITGQKGFQDLSLFLKYQLLERKALGGAFKIQTTGGLSTPVTNYTADLMPFSIGIHSKTASLRGILNYTADFGLYVTAEVGHTWRSNVIVDRDSYLFHNELVESDEMPVPNVFDYSARIGYINSRLQAELWYDAFTGLSGDDIRYNEAPQATNKMVAGQVGIFGKYFIIKRLALQAAVSQVLSGRNAGEAFTWSAGFTYFLDVNKKAEAAN
ncbi:MAG: transporter [Saprospiraceae bacterium]|nr:transporter [Saprospiraceae bacterium]